MINRVGSLTGILLSILLWASTPPLSVAQDVGLPGGNHLWGLDRRGESTVPQRDGIDEIELQFGWENRRVPSEVPLWGRSPALVDIDRNGDLEFAIVNGEGRLYVYQHDGALYPGFPTALHNGDRPEPWEDPTHRALVTVGDVERDGNPDLIYATDIGYLHAVGRTGREPRPFPIDLGRGVRASAIAAVDLNGDNGSELIFVTSRIRPLNDEEALLHIIDGQGIAYDGWPVRCGFGSGASPAVGDIDGDGAVEIIVTSARRGDQPGQVWAFRLDGTRVDGFPHGASETIGCSPVVVDWDTTAGAEIVFAASDQNQYQPSVQAFNGSAQSIQGFPSAIDGCHPFGGAIAFGMRQVSPMMLLYGEFNPEGNAAIRLVEKTGDEGELTNRVLVEIGVGTVGSVMAADVIGGLEPDLVAALAPSGGGEGRIVILDLSDENAEPFYLDLADYGGGAFSSSPTLWDSDGDGRTEIIALTTDGRILVWDTEGYFSGNIWPTERGDFSRSGRKLPYFNLAVDDRNHGDITPGQFLMTAYPNPFNSSLQITVEAASTSSLSLGLFDLSGRSLGSLYEGTIIAGNNKILLDAGNIGLAPGVYLLRGQGANGSVGNQRIIYLP